MSGWQRTFQNVGNQAEEMGRRVQSVGQSMTTAFAPLAYASGKAFGSMIKNSMEFEQQTRKAAVLTGGSYGQVKKDILEMATSSVYSTGQVAAAYAELGAKGFDAAQSTAALPGVLSAAAASGEDLGMVADTITSALNAFSMEAKDSGHVADVLAQAANATAAGVYDMQYAFKYAAGPAAQLGIGMEELAASVGIMSNAGIKGETAGTALRSAMLRLVKPPKAAANMLKELGVTTTDSSGNMKSLSQIIGELQKGMDGMTSAQKGAALATIFGTEAVSGMMALVSAGPEKIDKLTQSLIKSDGASKKAADSMLEGWAGAIVKMQSSIDVAARAFTDALAPAISFVADVIKKLADGFNGLSPTMKTVIATVASAVAVFTVFMAVLGVFISSIGATITAFGALVGWLGKSARVAKLASAAMVGLRAAFTFLTGPIGATIAILTLVGTALVQLYKHNETFRNAVNSAWESIKTTTISAVESMKAAFDSFGAYLATIPAKFSAMGSAIGAFFSSVITKLNGLGQMIGGAFGSAIDGISAKFSGISSAISPVVDFIKSSFSTIGNTIATLTPLIIRLGLTFLGVSGPVGWVIAIVASLGATIFKLVNTNEQAKSALMTAWESIKGVFSTVASVIMPIITSLAQGFIDAFAPLAPEFQKTGQVIAESFATLGPALAELGAAFGELGSTIASLFGEAVKAAVPIATEMFTGFGQIMQQVMPMVTELIKMFADTTIQIMPMISEGIQFLAQMFSEFATTVLPVFIEAFQTGFPIILQVIQTVFSIAGMLIQGFGEILSIIATTIIPIILQAVQAVFPVIVSIIQAAIPVAVAIIQGLATIITGVVIPAIQFILSVVQAVFPAIMGIITSVIGIITNIIKVFTAVLQGDWSGAWNAVKGITSNVMSLIGSIIQGAISLITAVVTSGLNLVQSIFSSVLSAISSLVSSIFSGIGSVISSTMSAAGSIISAMWNAAMSATSSILNQIYNTVTQIFNNVTSFLSGINLGDIGRNMMQGLLDGISGMAGAIWDKITDIGTGIKDKFTSLLSIHSPSRVFRDYGIYTGKGYVNGVDGMKRAIIKTSENMANWMQPEMLAVDTGSVNTGMAKAVAPSVYANNSRKPSTDVTSNFQREVTIENVIVMDGREIARATKGYLDNMRMQDVSIQSYLLGDKG